jgi:chloramphenicol-sensitive protein RarD
VLYLTPTYGHFPWLALILAMTFGLYGLLRKMVSVDALTGLMIETAMLAPAAVGFLLLDARGDLKLFHDSRGTDLLLLSAGVITAVPLLWFIEASRRLRLSTLGFLQYVAPTGQFLLAVLAYGEPFTKAHAVAFAFIWTALAIYSVDTVLTARAKTAAAGFPVAPE